MAMIFQPEGKQASATISLISKLQWVASVADNSLHEEVAQHVNIEHKRGRMHKKEVVLPWKLLDTSKYWRLFLIWRFKEFEGSTLLILDTAAMAQLVNILMLEATIAAGVPLGAKVVELVVVGKATDNNYVIDLQHSLASVDTSNLSTTRV